MKEKNDYPLMLTAKDVAEILNCSLQQAYRLFNQNLIPVAQFGGAHKMRRVSRDKFFDWLEDMHVTKTKEAQ